MIFPGFSWANLRRTRGKHSEYGSIPRLRGEFLWRQAMNAIDKGEAEMLYVAMFDEVDEGTAIFKLSGDPPVDQTAFHPIEEGLEPDHYLWLTGEIAGVLGGDREPTRAMPERD